MLQFVAYIGTYSQGWTVVDKVLNIAERGVLKAVLNPVFEVIANLKKAK